MTSLPFQFPVLAFCPDVGHGKPERDRLKYFFSAEDFSTCESWDLRYQSRTGMLLADSAQRCWRTSGVEDLGVTGPFWSRVLRFLVRQSLHRISCEIEEVQALTLQALKDRVCSVIDADPAAWGDEHIPEEGWDDPWQWWHQQTEAFKGRVAASQSVAEIIDVLFGEHLDTRPDP